MLDWHRRCLVFSWEIGLTSENAAITSHMADLIPNKVGKAVVGQEWRAQNAIRAVLRVDDGEMRVILDASEAH